jgi:hypothetical protein
MAARKWVVAASARVICYSGMLLCNSAHATLHGLLSRKLRSDGVRVHYSTTTVQGLQTTPDRQFAFSAFVHLCPAKRLVEERGRYAYFLNNYVRYCT